MMWLRMALLSVVVMTVVHADDRLLRKNVGPDFQKTRSLTRGKLEDLWEKEAALAEWETGRLLQMGGDMSFFPTRRPTRAPTRAPTNGTPRPTPAAGVTPGPNTQPPTQDNSCLMGGTRTDFLFDQLSLITDPSLLSNPSTPQGMAFLFMDTDPLLPNVCSYPTIFQRYGLATIYFSTSGDSWTDNTGWLGDSPECDWFGVVCTDGINLIELLLRK